MKRNLNKKEEDAAFRRKQKEDPNPNRSGKAINVKTEEYTTLPLQVEVPTEIRDFNLGLMFRESLDQNSGMLFIFDEVAEQSFHMRETRIPLDIAFITEEGIIESIKELEPFDENPVYSEGEVLCALEVNRGWFAENNVEVGDEIDIEEGKKDACYHKVKSRYSVWPSAYASGALVKCRKVGAANWGNKTKKEEFEIDEKFKTQYGDKTKLSQSSERKSLGRGSSIKDGSKKSGYESKKEFRDQSMKLRKHRERFGDLAKEETTLDEKCWKGYEKKGMKTMFGKRYPNCVKKEEVEIDEYYGMAGGMGGSLSKRLRDERFKSLPKTDAEAKKKEEVKEGDGDPCWDTHKQVGMKKKGNRMVPNCVPKNKVKEETEDSLRDRRMERGGVDGNTRYDRAPNCLLYTSPSPRD